jgi:microcystin-dependent protein
MDPYVGEIRIFAGNYAPSGWAFCNGQIQQVQANQALFTIIGNQYGGDGRTTFALPNLQGYAPMHQGTGTGLTPRGFAKNGGTSVVTLLDSEMPNHDHAAACQTTASQNVAKNAIWATSPGPVKSARRIYSNNVDIPMNTQAIKPVGGNQPHNNVQPNMIINFIIALEGVYPVKP